MKRLLFYSLLTLFSVNLFLSCSEQKNDDFSMIDYYPVTEENGGKWGFVDKEGKMYLSEEFKNQPSAVFNGLFFVEHNGKYTLYKAAKNQKK